MKNALKTLAAILLAATGFGLIILGISHARASAALVQCKNNLKIIGLALHASHDYKKHFPPATCSDTSLPPDHRLSWVIEVYPSYMEAGPMLKFDRTKAWDDPANNPPRGKLWSNSEGIINENYVMAGDGIQYFLCPENPGRMGNAKPCAIHYVGICGVGPGASMLPLSDANAGLFGHNRKVTLNDLKRGAPTTMMAAESLDIGPWTAGGHPTVRDVLPDKLPYFGESGQFGANHRGVSNVLFADATVRALSASMNPRIVEAMAAIAGDAELARFDE